MSAPIPILNKEQLEEIRIELLADHNKLKRTTLSAFETVATQLILVTAQVIKLKDEKQKLNTELQVSQVENKKLKDSKK